jgi:ATP-binding cassette, subfamily B, bacterial MsbA
MYRRLLRYLRPHRWMMAGTVACSVAAAALDGFSFALLIPFLNTLFGLQSAPDGEPGMLDRLLDRVVGTFLDESDPMGSLRTVILIILATIAAKNVFIWLGGQLGARLQEEVTRDLRNDVYEHAACLPLPYFTTTRVGQILSRVLTDTAQTRLLITQIVTQAVQNAALLIAYLAFLFSVSLKLSFVALVVAPILIGILQPLLKRLRRGYRRLANQHGEMTSVVQETVSGIRLVKTFGAEAYEQKRFRDASNSYSSALVRVTRTALLAQPITEVVGASIAMLVLWIGAREVLLGGGLEPAKLLVFLAVVMRLLQPLKQLSQIPTSAQASIAAAERLFDVLDTPTEGQTDRGTKQVDGFRDSLVFDNVEFAYASAPVLRGISFTARRGDVTALVGPSGAGKSTLVDLIPRLHEPTGGKILLDGVDIREITLKSLRSLIGIVSQDTVLFNDSVRNNIAYGAAAGAEHSRVEAAARAANAHEFIAALPEGYDTILGERGTRLSGGQRQRLAIARALLLDPPILVLDEATSALDTESERLVQQAIDRLLAGRTVFVIAHRLSTVSNASTILVLDQGTVVERGSHVELLEKNGVYARLHAIQFEDRSGGEEAE